MKNVKQDLSYFDVLNIKQDATIEEIKKAYKTLAKQYHPDKYKSEEEKKKAEKQFNVIKKAYDELLKIYDENKNQEINNNFNYENIYENSDFISFFSKTTASMNQAFENAQKEDKSKERQAVNFIKTQINNLNISMVYVYECIRKEKMFIHWDVKPEELNDIMLKEVLYRRHIMESKSYKCFLKNRKLFFNPDIYLKIKIKPEVANNKFNKKINYVLPGICSECNGEGCKKCVNGISYTTVEKTLKFSHIEDKDTYEVLEGGFKNEIVSGNLIITFKYEPGLDTDFEIKQVNGKNTISEKIENVVNEARLTITDLLIVLKHHKLHVIYGSIIFTLLLIIIILLAVLI